MTLEISGKCNYDYIWINTATFHLKDGGTVTIDRDASYISTDGDSFSMTWEDVYLWAINSEYIFNDSGAYLNDSFSKLIEGASIELYIDEDVEDDDYRIWDIEWCLCGENCVKGKEKTS